MDFISLIAGVITGVVSSFIVWVFLFHYLSPKIEFSESICKSILEDRGCGFVYRIKMQNLRRRNAINAKLKGTIVIPNLYYNNLNELIDLPLGTKVIMEFRSYRKPGRNRRIFSLNLDEANLCKELQKPYFPIEVRMLARDKNLMLEDILKIRDGSHVIIDVYCYDSFSGTAKLFRSKYYYQNDIIIGLFEKNSLRIVPQKD